MILIARHQCRAVLDGIHSGFSGPGNALRTVRVRRDFAAQAMRVRDDGFHFFQRVLRSARIVALGKHAAGSANLDYVSAVFDDLADFCCTPSMPSATPSALACIRMAAGFRRNGRP